MIVAALFIISGYSRGNSMEYSNVRVRKRYNKLIAYLMADGVCIAIMGIIGIFLSFTDRFSESLNVQGAVLFLLVALVGAAITGLVTLYVFSRTPRDERLLTWLRCLCLGLMIGLKIVLTVFVITIPLLIKLDLNAKYYEYDYTGYFDGDEIRLKRIEQGKYEDINGNIYYSYE